jgi:hypothetical protein
MITHLLADVALPAAAGSLAYSEEAFMGEYPRCGC